MSKWQIVSNCVNCGAPIWIPTTWQGITPPPSNFSCTCKGSPTNIYYSNNSSISPTNVVYALPEELKEQELKNEIENIKKEMEAIREELASMKKEKKFLKKDKKICSRID